MEAASLQKSCRACSKNFIAQMEAILKQRTVTVWDFMFAACWLRPWTGKFGRRITHVGEQCFPSCYHSGKAKMIVTSVLLIDDDDTLLELLSEHLVGAGYQVKTANSAVKGLLLVMDVKPDLIILDVMMPGMDGWEVCRRIRESSTIPIIMLTAKEQELDKLRGFNLGVDDYVTKPFSFAELTARIGAVLSRSRKSSTSSQVIKSVDLVVDLDRHRVAKAGKTITLSPTEYRLLEVLVAHPNRTVPAETLLNEVWGSEYSGELEHVKHYIWLLRKKIETDPGNPQHILTDRGFGYRFE
jgi:two-component system KDP operon response regulator KdpE